MTAIQTLQLAVALSLAPPNLASSPAAPVTARPDVAYVVSIPQPHTHVFSVEMRITDIDGDTIDVSMPVWTPGSYLVREYERHVVRFTASDVTGKPLSWRKLDKNTWRITNDRAASILIDYDVYAREPGIRWSFVNETGGHILGPSLFMHVVGATDRPTSVTFHLPQGWRIDGGIAPTGDPPVISARSYHDLIDTPLLIGCSEHDVLDPCPHRGHRAHRTRLERHNQRVTVKPPAAEVAGASREHEHLRMGGGIRTFLTAIVVGGNNRSVRIQQHGADRHVVVFGRSCGLLECQSHGCGLIHYSDASLYTPSSYGGIA